MAPGGNSVQPGRRSRIGKSPPYTASSVRLTPAASAEKAAAAYVLYGVGAGDRAGGELRQRSCRAGSRATGSAAAELELGATIGAEGRSGEGERGGAQA